MKLLWSKPIPMDTPWEPAYRGVFCKIADKIHFMFKDGKNVGIMSEDAEAVRLTPAGEKLIPLPNAWALSENGNGPRLFLGPELLLEIHDFAIQEITQPARQAEYRSLIKPEKYHEEATFEQGGYCISHKGNFGYRCTKDGKLLWEFRGQGYLYTDVCFRDDRIYFGTAGQGGYFYVLNLKTGEALAKIKTGGTASLCVVDDCCYVLSNEKHVQLICVGLKDGMIRQEVSLPGKASVYSTLKLIDTRIHAITFSYKNQRLHQAIWSCTEV